MHARNHRGMLSLYIHVLRAIVSNAGWLVLCYYAIIEVRLVSLNH